MSRAEKKDLKESFENEYGRKITYAQIDKFLEDLVFRKFSCGVNDQVNDFMDTEDRRKEDDRRQAFREKWGSK